MFIMISVLLCSHTRTILWPVVDARRVVLCLSQLLTNQVGVAMRGIHIYPNGSWVIDL